MTATFPLAPTTRHPEKACPLENNVNPPAGTTGNSKPPFLVRLAAADAVVADPVVADAVPQLAINTPADSAAQATPWEMNARMTRPPLSCASIPGGISSCQAAVSSVFDRLLRGLEPSQERQHISRDVPDGTVVTDRHILHPGTLSGRGRCCGLPEIVGAAAGYNARQPPLDVTQRNNQARNTQRHSQRSPHPGHLAEAADKVGEHEQPDPGPAVVRRHGGQVLQQQPEFLGATAGAGARPAQVIQVEQRVRLATLFEQVGDLRSDRALA